MTDKAIHQDIVNRYDKILISKGALIKERGGDSYFSDEHLRHMLLQLRFDTERMPREKANRFLGFVQGVMGHKGYIDIDEEREFTREYF